MDQGRTKGKSKFNSIACFFACLGRPPKNEQEIRTLALEKPERVFVGSHSVCFYTLLASLCDFGQYEGEPLPIGLVIAVAEARRYMDDTSHFT